MISKKALLIAVGLAFALPSISHAMTREERIEQIRKMTAELEAEENKAMQDAQAEAVRIEENAKQKEASLQSSIESVNKLLTDTRLEKKKELTKALKELNQNVKASYAANQERLAEERRLNKMIVNKHYKRMGFVSKATDALIKIVTA